MTPKQLYDRFRSDVEDDVVPYLWSKEEVLGYMDDAQQMLCRESFGIRDASSPATQCEVIAGEAFTELDPSILLVRSVTLASSGKKLRVYSYEELYGANTEPSCWGGRFMSLSGPVIAVVIGMEEGKLRLVQIPAVEDTLELVVERLPLTIPDLTTESELEVRREHHLALLMWMKHLAFAKEDSETYDRARSDENEMRFLAYCAKAKAEKERRDSKPRLIAYGGL